MSYFVPVSSVGAPEVKSAFWKTGLVKSISTSPVR